MKIKHEVRLSARFAVLLFFILSIACFVQVVLMAFPLFENLLFESYLFNGVFALVSYVSLLAINRINPKVTGFAFMGGSALKFMIFFLVFYPVYYADGSILRQEILSFFVPYALCLTTELVMYVRN